MPTVPVDDDGVVLYYEDSGAPEGSTTYLTVVLLHGLLFHGEIFKRLLPYAAANDLRIVRVNQRDYPGSSPYTVDDLEALTSGDPGRQANVFKGLGHQFAALVENLAEKLQLPSVVEVDGKKVGGIALVTWSMSNGLAMAMLGNASSSSEQTKSSLKQYLRTLVMLDPVAGTAMGAGPAQGAYHPFRDTSLSVEERVKLAMVWLSYYFTNAGDLDQVTPEFLQTRVALHETAASQEGTMDASKTPTLLKMSKEEVDSSKDGDALVRSSLPILRSSPAVFRQNFERALFDTEGVLPSVKVVVAWCDESMGDSVWAAKLINDQLKAEQPKGKIRRDITMHRMEGANHFPHWDHPEMVIKLLTTAA